MGQRLVVIVYEKLDYRNELLQILNGAGHEVMVFGDAREFLFSLNSLPRECCVLLGQQLGSLNGLAVYSEIRQQNQTWPVILITEDATVAMCIEAFAKGFAFVFEKPVVQADLLLRVEAGLRECSNEIAEQDETAEQKRLLSSLSIRESQVLELIADGKLNKQIADSMSLSVRTVETFRQRIMKKLGAESFAALIAFAIAAGVRKSRN